MQKKDVKMTILYCGKSTVKQEQDDMCFALVFRAKQGNQNALTVLGQESYIVKSMIRLKSMLHKIAVKSFYQRTD